MAVLCPYCGKEYKTDKTLNAHIKAFHALPSWVKEGVYVYVRAPGTTEIPKRPSVHCCLYIETLTENIIQYREVGIGELIRLKVEDFIHDYCGAGKSSDILQHVYVPFDGTVKVTDLMGLAFCYADKWITGICGISGSNSDRFATLGEEHIVGFITNKGNVKYMQVKEFIKFASDGEGKTLFSFRPVE